MRNSSNDSNRWLPCAFIMKKIRLTEEGTKKFKEALDMFMTNPARGNAMLDRIRDEQNEKRCENCKYYVEFNDACKLHGYNVYKCVDGNFKDFEVK